MIILKKSFSIIISILFKYCIFDMSVNSSMIVNKGIPARWAQK